MVGSKLVIVDSAFFWFSQPIRAIAKGKLEQDEGIQEASNSEFVASMRANGPKTCWCEGLGERVSGASTRSYRAKQVGDCR